MTDVFPSRMTLARVAAAAAGALVLSACTTGDGGDGVAAPSPEPAPTDDRTATAPPSPTQGDSPSPTADASPSPDATDHPPPTPTVDTPALDIACTLEPDLPQVDRIHYTVPADWEVDGSCTELDPEVEQVAEGTEAELAIFVDVSAAPYREVVGDTTASRDVVTWIGATVGRQAVRRTSVATGDALAPEGRPRTLWATDLDSGTDQEGGVLTMSTGVGEDDGYGLAQATLDSIAQTVVIQPTAPEEPDEAFSVVRAEGGGTPYTVTYDGDCFQLRPGGPADAPSEELCELDPTTGEVVPGVLGDDVLVGYAPATSIAVQSDRIQPPYGLTAGIEGGAVFAFRVGEVPSRLSAIGPGGEELATAPVG